MNTITEEAIRFLRQGHDGKLQCPRCGWLKGKTWHCSLCEGHEEDIEQWYCKMLSRIQAHDLQVALETVNDLYDGGLTEREGEVSGYGQAFIEGFREAQSQFRTALTKRLTGKEGK